MIKAKLLAILTAAVFLIPGVSFAAEEITEEEIVPKDTQIYIDEEDEYTFLQRGRLTNLLAVSVGYDDNSHLDSNRDGDAFSQAFFKTRFTSPITRDKKVNAILGYDLMALTYAGESTLDIVKNSVTAGIENKISDKWELSGGYRLDAYSYINSASDSFIENAGYWKIKENLPFKMYHQLGYELGYKNYDSRHVRTIVSDDGSILDSNKKRSDLRNTVNYEIGKYFTNDLFNIGYEYYNNDSNERYINYYDYDSYKNSASLTHLFNQKVFSFFSFARQYRKYRSRSITLDTKSREWDKTYLFASALYYNLNKSVTVGLSYTYRQNVSNEPVENYSGSLVATSAYFKF